MRTALITGGTKGIGLASARHLRKTGWRIIAMAREVTAEFVPSKQFMQVSVLFQLVPGWFTPAPCEACSCGLAR